MKDLRWTARTAASIAVLALCVLGWPEITGATVPVTLYAAASATGTGDCLSVANACALGTAITDITAGATIKLVTAGIEGTTASYYQGGFSISTSGTSSGSPVTIEPNSGLASAPILDGGGAHGVLAIKNNMYLNVDGLTIQHGGLAQGAGINNDLGGHLTVSGSTFSDNVSVQNGGAIDNADDADGSGIGTLTVSDSTFSGNTATWNGGAIDNGDSGGNGTLTVTDSTFSDNSVGGSGGEGGAVNNGGNFDNAPGTGTASITGSTFSGNAADYGAAIDNGDHLGTGTLTVTDSTFAANNAVSDGGAIDNGDNGGNGALTATASTFAGNVAGTHGADIDNGDNGPTGTTTVTVTANVVADSCTQASGTWTDHGYNVGADTTCFHSGTADNDSAGSNLSTRLGPLANNGGPTQTMALLPTNPAIAIVPNPTSGLCPVAADQRGTAGASGKPCDAGAVQLEGQTITFTSSIPTNALAGLSSYTPTATATSGLAVTIAVDPTSASVCVISGGVVTFIGPGTCQLDATQAGNGNWAAAPRATQSFIVNISTYHGYWLVAGDGGIFNFGKAKFFGSTGALHLQRPVVGMTPTADRQGYWMVATDGGMFAFGDAKYHGSIPGLGIAPAGSGAVKELAAPIVAMVASPDGKGYLMVASDGGVFAFGDALFHGSCPGIGGCNGSVVAVVPDQGELGYWVVTSTGHVYAFGNAGSVASGAPGATPAPIAGAAASASGHGYLIVDAKGDVYSYGDAHKYSGSTPSGQIVGIVPTSTGLGYWLMGSNGAVYTYGDAPSDGSMAGKALNAPIVTAAGF